jgi:NAD(P)-dependent dehydrogenase (short-subunit alcohol dehydrogenase family)
MVHVTTRFPKDCAKRFAEEADFSTFKNRLKIYGLGMFHSFVLTIDLRHIPSVIRFTEYLSTNYPRLDILINNAAQTIRRPTAFYTRLAVEELQVSIEDLEEDVKAILPNDFNMGMDAFQHVPGIENVMGNKAITQQASNTQLVGLPKLGTLKAFSDTTNISTSACMF